jgi:hypothetical protein
MVLAAETTSLGSKDRISLRIEGSSASGSVRVRMVSIKLPQESCACGT